MNKKTIIVSIFAILLVLSTPMVSNIQAQQTEPCQEEKEIKYKLCTKISTGNPTISCGAVQIVMDLLIFLGLMMINEGFLIMALNLYDNFKDRCGLEIWDPYWEP